MPIQERTRIEGRSAARLPHREAKSRGGVSANDVCTYLRSSDPGGNEIIKAPFEPDLEVQAGRQVSVLLVKVFFISDNSLREWVKQIMPLEPPKNGLSSVVLSV